MKTLDDLGITVREEIQKFTSHSAEIAILIINFIRSHEGMTKNDFAKLVGKTPSDITRWISGSHNFTIETLSLIEAKTGMKIIIELTNSQKEKYLKNEVFSLENKSNDFGIMEISKEHSKRTRSRVGTKELISRNSKKKYCSSRRKGGWYNRFRKIPSNIRFFSNSAKQIRSGKPHRTKNKKSKHISFYVKEQKRIRTRNLQGYTD